MLLFLVVCILLVLIYVAHETDSLAKSHAAIATFIEAELKELKSSLKVSPGGWHTLPPEVRNKGFPGADPFAKFAKGAVFDVAFRPVLVPMSSFVLRGGGQDSSSPARTRLPADVGEGLRGDAVQAIEGVRKSANEKDERGGLRVWPCAALFPFFERPKIDPQLAGKDGARAAKLPASISNQAAVHLR